MRVPLRQRFDALRSVSAIRYADWAASRDVCISRPIKAYLRARGNAYRGGEGSGSAADGEMSPRFGDYSTAVDRARRYPIGVRDDREAWEAIADDSLTWIYDDTLNRAATRPYVTINRRGIVVNCRSGKLPLFAPRLLLEPAAIKPAERELEGRGEMLTIESAFIRD